jgi:hypothetical protein
MVIIKDTYLEVFLFYNPNGEIEDIHAHQILSIGYLSFIGFSEPGELPRVIND